MSDNEIREILRERKRKQRRAEKRAAVLEAAGGALAWSSLIFACFMMSVIGG